MKKKKIERSSEKNVQNFRETIWEECVKERELLFCKCLEELMIKKSQTFGMMSAGGSCRFLLPLMQQHMAKQMAMISSEIANEPDAIMIIGNFPVKWI